MAGPPAFQAFTLKFNGLANRIISDIAVLPAFDPNAPPDPLPQGIETQALWDTGATRSVISDHVAKTLGLLPVGTTKVNHAGGVGTSPTYLVNFRLPHRVDVRGVLVTEFPGSERGFGAIVGMDVIGFGDLALTNVNGQTWVSFRTPSCEAVDFVLQANRQAFRGVGRNDPCPCGALRPDGGRRKFKHCHGADQPR
jgi:hypothetical protein